MYNREKCNWPVLAISIRRRRNDGGEVAGAGLALKAEK